MVARIPYSLAPILVMSFVGNLPLVLTDIPKYVTAQFITFCRYDEELIYEMHLKREGRKSKGGHPNEMREREVDEGVGPAVGSQPAQPLGLEFRRNFADPFDLFDILETRRYNRSSESCLDRKKKEYPTHSA